MPVLRAARRGLAPYLKVKLTGAEYGAYGGSPFRALLLPMPAAAILPVEFLTITGIAMEFTEKEQAVLRIAQKSIPDSLTPYADMAAAAGLTEEEVLTLLSRLKESGAIRRFGASIKHQRTGWTHNAMVAWVVSPDVVDEVGRKASEHPRISHCYYRPSPYPAWPYTFYTMIHGKSEQDCLDVVEELRRTTSLETCEVLESLKELKKNFHDVLCGAVEVTGVRYEYQAFS